MSGSSAFDGRPKAPSGGKITASEAQEIIGEIKASRPHLFRRTRRAGYFRGIDVYRPDKLPDIFANAASIFYKYHGRLPDFRNPKTTTDYFFLIKFFEEFPVSPSPVDKLGSSQYISRKLRRAVGVPLRPWISTGQLLPADGEVPPGRYWLKMSHGNAMQEKIAWPPSPEARAHFEARVAEWRRRAYGITWGEWWYSQVEARSYLEVDLSGKMGVRPEVKMFVRNGVVKLIYTTSRTGTREKVKRFFDSTLSPIEDATIGTPTAADVLPRSIGLMTDVAREIGKRFRIVRVDFLNAAGSHPYFGEITLCNQNARVPFWPDSFDDRVRRMLFE